MEAPKFVSEYPFPPPYYKDVIIDQPPSIPHVFIEPYNGVILPRVPDTYDSNKNYKAIFKRCAALLFKNMNYVLKKLNKIKQFN